MTINRNILLCLSHEHRFYRLYMMGKTNVVEVYNHSVSYSTSHPIAFSCQDIYPPSEGRNVEVAIGQELVNNIFPAPTPTPSPTPGMTTPAITTPAPTAPIPVITSPVLTPTATKTPTPTASPTTQITYTIPEKNNPKPYKDSNTNSDQDTNCNGNTYLHYPRIYNTNSTYTNPRNSTKSSIPRIASPISTWSGNLVLEP